MGRIIVDDKFEVRGVYTCPMCNKLFLGVSPVWDVASLICLNCGWDKTGGVLVSNYTNLDGEEGHRKYLNDLFNMWNDSVSKHTGAYIKKVSVLRI